MLSEEIKRSLMKNWGDKAEAMACFVEVNLVDPMSGWNCYIYALDPNDEDTVMCMVHTKKKGVELVRGSLKELGLLYNQDGEGCLVDSNFRKIRAAQLFKKLSGAR